MSAFFERGVPRRAPDAQVFREEEQVPHWLSDARLERIEEARKRAKRKEARP